MQVIERLVGFKCSRGLSMLLNCLLGCCWTVYFSKFWVSNSSPLSFLQSYEPADPMSRKDSQTTAHSQSFSRNDSLSRAAHSDTHRDPTITSSSTQQNPSQYVLHPSNQDQAQSSASDGRVPPGLANTLEHIMGQLDILTRVSRRWANLWWQRAW